MRELYVSCTPVSVLKHIPDKLDRMMNSSGDTFIVYTETNLQTILRWSRITKSVTGVASYSRTSHDSLLCEAG